MSDYMIVTWFVALLFGTSILTRAYLRNSVPALSMMAFAASVVLLLAHYIGH